MSFGCSFFRNQEPYPKMLDLIRDLKAHYGLRIAVVSNESREVNAYRIRKFKLDGFVDTFISSCFVHARKPDVEMFRLALDIAQAPAGKVLYIENTPMFVQIAEGLGIRSILLASTRIDLRELLHSDCSISKRSSMKQLTHDSDDQWRFVEHQVRPLRSR